MSEPETPSDQPKRRVVKVRKRTPTPTLPEVVQHQQVQFKQEIPLRKKAVRTLRVAKGQRQQKEKFNLEDDFYLENFGNPEDFLVLKENVKNLSLHYDSQGNVAPFSLIGDGKLYRAFNERINKNQQKQANRRVSTSQQPVDKTQLFNDRVRQINQGMINEREFEQQKVRSMTPVQRLRYLRQQKVLEKYTNATNVWQKIQQNISRRLKKPEENLAITRTNQHRDKLEKTEFLKRGVTPQEQSGVFSWYMSLRSDENMPKGAFFQLGNPTTGLFTRMNERSSSIQPRIRKPGDMSATQRTFRDSNYLKTRLQWEIDQGGPDISDSDLDQLLVQGQSKYQSEMEAVQIFGVERVDLSKLQSGSQAEEILAEHYDMTD